MEILASCGAVLLDPVDDAVEAYGVTMGEEMFRFLSENGEKKQITEISRRFQTFTKIDRNWMEKRVGRLPEKRPSVPLGS